MYCLNCGKRIAEGDSFCGYCGAPVEERPAARTAGRSNTSNTSKSASEKKGMTLIIGAGIAFIIMFMLGSMVYLHKEGVIFNSCGHVANAEEQDQECEYDDNEEDYDDNDDCDYENPYDEYYYCTEYELYDDDVPIFFPDSDERYLTEDEIYELSSAQRQKVQNDIYARHGYIFQTSWISNYYFDQPDYLPFYDDMDDARSDMNDYEIENLEMLED